MGAASGLDAAYLQEHHTFVSGTAKRFGVSSSTLNQAVRKMERSCERRAAFMLRTGTRLG